MQTPQISDNPAKSADDGKIRHPILDLPLTRVIRPEYALQLQEVLRLYTVGNLLVAWQGITAQRSIEDVFDTPEQAHQAIATCAAWVGFQIVAAPGVVPAWWQSEDHAA